MSVKERYIIGVDLGGTNIVAGAMPLDGSREIAMRTTPTLAEGGAVGVVERITGMIEQVIANFKTWRIMHTDYRRPLDSFDTTISAVVGLHFYRMA